MSAVDKSKYAKIFDKNGQYSLGIYHTRIKKLAKAASIDISFPSDVKTYPKIIKTGTATFTKMTAFQSTGKSNTIAGFCLMTEMKNIERQTRRRLCEVLEKEFEEDVREDQLLEDSDDENGL